MNALPVEGRNIAPPRDSTPMIGRTAEMRHVRQLLDAVEAGLPRFLVVSGEPGIGKTRLLQSLAGEADSRRFQVFSGRGTELEQEVPFVPVVEALDAAAATLGRESRRDSRTSSPTSGACSLAPGPRDPLSAIRG